MFIRHGAHDKYKLLSSCYCLEKWAFSVFFAIWPELPVLQELQELRVLQEQPEQQVRRW